MLLEHSSTLKTEVVRWCTLTVAAFLIAFNIKAFLNNGGLVPGGFSGIAVLTQRIFASYFNITIPYSALYLPLNMVGFYIGFRSIGRKFTCYSIYVIVLSSFLTDLIPNISVTYDVLLIALFGAITNGTAITLCLHASACSGGTDFISIYYSEKKGIDAWNYIFAGNVTILIISGVLFGYDKALYSIIYQFTQTQILNTFNKRYQKHTLWIITDKPTEIYKAIYDITHHGATQFTGASCYRHNDIDMVYSVVSSDEIHMVMNAIRAIDDKAFINVQKTDLVGGNFYKRPTE